MGILGTHAPRVPNLAPQITAMESRALAIIEFNKMIFRREPQRGDKIIAQSETLGMVGKDAMPCKVEIIISPLQGLGYTQGCTLGYHIPLRWSFNQNVFFQIPKARGGACVPTRAFPEDSYEKM